MSQKRIFNEKYLFMITALILAVAIFIINYFTPYLADDYNWLQHKIYGTNDTIHSFHDLLISIKSFYLGWGGRVLGYVLSVLFSYLPPIVFDVINTLCYMLATTLIYLISIGHSRHNLPLYIAIHVLLWVCVPDYGQVMFWLSGAGNYLWSSIPVLVILLLYRNTTIALIKEEQKPLHFLYHIPAFLIGYLAGTAMENMSAGVLVITTCHLLYYRKKNYKVQRPLITSYIGSIIGFAVLLLAPGNSLRSEADSLNLSMLFKICIINYYWFTFVGGICIIWIALALIIKHIASDTWKSVIAESFMYLTGAFTAAFCMLAAPSSPERTWYIVCVYAILAIGIFYNALVPYWHKPVSQVISVTACGALLLLLVAMADTTVYSREISIQTAARAAYIAEQKALGNMDIQTPVITHQYPLRAQHDALTGLSDITTDASYWINQSMASYFGVNTITGVT